MCNAHSEVPGVVFYVASDSWLYELPANYPNILACSGVSSFSVIVKVPNDVQSSDWRYVYGRFLATSLLLH